MPPKVMNDVISDATDPATKRPDLPPAKKVGQTFHGMDLPPFPHHVNLPATVLPSNPWDIFRLFITTDMISTIVNFTNTRVSQLPREDLKPRALLNSWYNVTIEKIYAYIGIRIYMGLHSEVCTRDYWSSGLNKPSHPLTEVMSRERYEAIHTRMRVATAEPGTEFEAVFERVCIHYIYQRLFLILEQLEPLNSHIMETSLVLWTSGRDLAIDEAMCPFQGRSFDTLIIPNKPIEEGYKIWVMAQRGYFLSWVFHRKGKIKDSKKRGPLGPYKVKQLKALGNNNSSAVVAELADRLTTTGHIFYLDNLFTNVKLLKYMRERGFGVTGTCTAKSGILASFAQMKAQDAKKDTIPWGTLHSEPSEDEDIQFVAWKDNALVLFMTTVAGELDLVEKERKRPSETSTSAKTARVPFGNNPTALLGIPVLDEKYNHYMGAIDQGNQLKAGYTFQEIHRRGGHHSLITWLLETAVVNSYLLSFYSLVLEKEKFTNHKAFSKLLLTSALILGDLAD